MDEEKRRQIHKALERSRREVAELMAHAHRASARRRKDQGTWLTLVVLGEIYWFFRLLPEGIGLWDLTGILWLGRLCCNIVFLVWIFQPIEKTRKRKEGRAWLIAIACNAVFVLGTFVARQSALGVAVQVASLVCYAVFLAWLWKWG